MKPETECIFGQIDETISRQCGGRPTDHHVLGKSEGGIDEAVVRACEKHHSQCHESDVHGGENFAFLFVLHKYGEEAPELEPVSPLTVFFDIQRWTKSMVDFYGLEDQKNAPMVSIIHNNTEEQLSRQEAWKMAYRTNDWVAIGALIEIEAQSYETMSLDDYAPSVDDMPNPDPTYLYEEGPQIAKALRKMRATMLDQVEKNARNGIVSDFSGSIKKIRSKNGRNGQGAAKEKMVVLA